MLINQNRQGMWYCRVYWHGLQEACANDALLYETVAQWVEACHLGQDATEDNCAGKTHHPG